MRSHELALQLLAEPDLEVVVEYPTDFRDDEIPSTVVTGVRPTIYSGRHAMEVVVG